MCPEHLLANLVELAMFSRSVAGNRLVAPHVTQMFVDTPEGRP